MDVISIIGVPMDLGQSRRGVDMGPSAISYACIMERLERVAYIINNLRDIQIKRPTKREEYKQNSKQPLKNLEQVIEANEKLAKMVEQEVSKGNFPLILGGDHSIAIGSLSGIAKHYYNLGIIWYDTHCYLNSNKTSPS